MYIRGDDITCVELKICIFKNFVKNYQNAIELL